MFTFRFLRVLVDCGDGFLLKTLVIGLVLLRDGTLFLYSVIEYLLAGLLGLFQSKLCAFVVDIGLPVHRRLSSLIMEQIRCADEVKLALEVIVKIVGVELLLIFNTILVEIELFVVFFNLPYLFNSECLNYSITYLELLLILIMIFLYGLIGSFRFPSDGGKGLSEKIML